MMQVSSFSPSYSANQRTHGFYNRPSALVQNLTFSKNANQKTDQGVGAIGCSLFGLGSIVSFFNPKGILDVLPDITAFPENGLLGIVLGIISVTMGWINARENK